MAGNRVVLELVANLGAIEDTLNGSDRALVAAREAIYNAGQHADYMEVSAALLQIRRHLMSILAGPVVTHLRDI
jgi:hypothetical protein